MRLKQILTILFASPLFIAITTQSQSHAQTQSSSSASAAPARGMINAQGVEVFWDEPVEVPLAQARQDVLAYTNRARAELGCPPLVLNERLNVASQRQANGMAVLDYFDHEAPDGSHPHNRVHDAGYDYALVAENIAAGQINGAAAVDEWMHSPHHRANIAECSFTELGVGYAFENDDQIMPPDEAPLFHYWVQVFGVPR